MKPGGSLGKIFVSTVESREAIKALLIKAIFPVLKPQSIMCNAVIEISAMNLPKRLELNAHLNAPDPKIFYAPDATGYTDYPFLKLHTN